MCTFIARTRAFVASLLVVVLVLAHPAYAFAAFVRGDTAQNFARVLEPADFELVYPLAQHDVLKLEGELAAGETKSFDVAWKLRLSDALIDRAGNRFDLELEVDHIVVHSQEDITGTLARFDSLALYAGQGCVLSCDVHIRALQGDDSPLEGTYVLSASGIDSVVDVSVEEQSEVAADSLKVVSGLRSDIVAPQNAALVSSEENTRISATGADGESIIAFVADANECVLRLQTADVLQLMPGALELAEPEPVPEEPAKVMFNAASAEVEPLETDDAEASEETDPQEEPSDEAGDATQTQDDDAQTDEDAAQEENDGDASVYEDAQAEPASEAPQQEESAEETRESTPQSQNNQKEEAQNNAPLNEDAPAEELYEDLPMFTVTFKDPDNRILSVEMVAYGEAAPAPRIPRRVDEHFIYWDRSFSYVTSDLVVHAVYAPGGLPGTGDTSVASAALALALAGLCCFTSSKLHSLRATLHS